ncbi:MAG TPA: hypothetical protein VHY58_00130 [Streptosporangiaceae bacterium]|nr:hypothetical protein [Streptosporangiaceae bacterium]
MTAPRRCPTSPGGLTPAGRSALHTIDVAQHGWCETLGEKTGEATLRDTAAGLRHVMDAVDGGPA